MKTQLVILEKSVLPDGRILVAGSITGQPLTTGRIGHASVESSHTEIEIVSVGIVDSTRVNPNMQALQIKIRKGCEGVLPGTIFEFE